MIIFPFHDMVNINGYYMVNDGEFHGNIDGFSSSEYYLGIQKWRLNGTSHEHG